MSTLARKFPNILKNCRWDCYKRTINLRKTFSSHSGDENNKVNRPMVMEEDINPSSCNLSEDILEEPTTCCMSGCTNCVWIQYAEKLSEKIKNSSDDVQKIIMEKVTDPNMRAFLSLELRCRNLIK